MAFLPSWFSNQKKKKKKKKKKKNPYFQNYSVGIYPLLGYPAI
jgi:hypothetical protein